MARYGPVRIQALEGSPTTIGEITLIPRACLVTLGRRQASVSRERFGGWGWAWALLLPIAVIEERSGRRRRIPLPDRTGQALLAMAVVGLAVVLISILAEMLSEPSWQK